MRRFLRWLNRRLNIVSDDPWYGQADIRLDHLAGNHWGCNHDR